MCATGNGQRATGRVVSLKAGQWVDQDVCYSSILRSRNIDNAQNCVRTEFLFGFVFGQTAALAHLAHLARAVLLLLLLLRMLAWPLFVLLLLLAGLVFLFRELFHCQLRSDDPGRLALRGNGVFQMLLDGCSLPGARRRR